MRVNWLYLTLTSLATLSSASSGCWSEVISGRSPGANIVSKGYTHSSSASSAACQASCRGGHTLMAGMFYRGVGGFTRAQTVQFLFSSLALSLIHI